jgi:pyridoxal phosphate enzyme (YggS family)
MTIAERITNIRAGLPANVRLIAVTKQVPVDAMREAYAAGIRDFGESRIQEAEAKQTQLSDLPDITWHLIGHLQSNKVQKALEQFQWIHSVDSLKLAQRLDRLASEQPFKPHVCLQVKILSDPGKFGWTIPDLLADLPALAQCRHLQIQGLMTIPPFEIDEAETLAVFDSTRELATQIAEQNWPNIQMQQLSMGMSDDYPLAVKAGATMIRLGTVLFGKRTT